MIMMMIQQTKSLNPGGYLRHYNYPTVLEHAHTLTYRDPFRSDSFEEPIRFLLTF